MTKPATVGSRYPLTSADFPAMPEYDPADVGRYLQSGFCIDCGRNLHHGHTLACSGVPSQVWPDICPECGDHNHAGCVHLSAWGRCGCGCREARYAT